MEEEKKDRMRKKGRAKKREKKKQENDEEGFDTGSVGKPRWKRGESREREAAGTESEGARSV